MLARPDAADRARRRQNFGCDFVGAQQTKAVPLHQFRHARQQMIVAAAESRQRARYETEAFKVGVNLPDRRPHQRADQHHVAAAGGARQPHEFSDLADIDPMMRKAFDRGAFGRAAQRKQQDRTPALDHRFRDRHRQGAAAANHRERALLAQRRRCAHVSSSASARLIAIVSGLLPARIKSNMRTTSSFDA